MILYQVWASLPLLGPALWYLFVWGTSLKQILMYCFTLVSQTITFTHPPNTQLNSFHYYLGGNILTEYEDIIWNKSSVWLDYIEDWTRLNQFGMFEEQEKKCCHNLVIQLSRYQHEVPSSCNTTVYLSWLLHSENVLGGKVHRQERFVSVYEHENFWSSQS